MGLLKRKHSKIQLKVKPWYNSDEVHEVATAIFSDDIEAKKWGLDKIKVWKLRNNSSHIIDATAALVRAKFQDDLDATGTFYCDEDEIQLMYMQGIIRFVRLMMESVPNGSSPVPASLAAKKLELPSWIVNLRHASTHSCIPPLVELRNAGIVALNFLRQSYWDKVSLKSEISAKPNNNLVSLEANIIAIIKSYAYKKYRNLIPTPGTIRRREACSCTEELLIMAALFKKDSTQFFNVLLRPGVFFFVPSDVNLIEKGFDNGDLSLPSFVFEMWAPLIRCFNMAHKIQLFVEHLVDCHKSFSLFYQKMACAWILKLINTAIDEEQARDESDPIANIYQSQKWIFDWYLLSVKCVLKASKCMPAILPLIWQQVYPPLRPEVTSRLAILVTVYLGALPSEAKNELLPKPLVSTKDIIKQEYEEHNTQPTNPWKKSTANVNWSELPLGFVFDSPAHFVKPSFNDKEDEAMEVVDPAPNALNAESEKEESAAKSSKSVPVNTTVREAVPYIITKDGFY